MLRNYQPNDLDDAIRILLELTQNDHTTLDLYKDKERDFIASLHMSLGANLRNEWYLWWWKDHDYSNWPDTKPKIVEWFNKHQIYHADDMSSIILISAYRKYFDLPLDLENQIAKYNQYWLEKTGSINPMNM